MNRSFFETDLFVFILFILLFFHSNNISKNKKSFTIIKYLIVFVMTMMISDIVYYLIDGKLFFGARFLNNIIMILYFVATAVSSFLWMCYTYYRLHNNLSFSKKEKIMYLTPMLLLIVMTLLSPITHWIYYIDEANCYVRGNLYVAQLILSYGYIIEGAIISLKRYNTEILHENKKNCLELCGYTILPLVGGLIQGLNFGTNTVVPTIAISLIMIYLDGMKQEILLDPLSQLYNRGQFDKYLDEKVKNSRRNQLVLLFMDIDRFKLINDKYGHIEGDRAIQCVSKILQLVFGNTKAFLARYGGDEFAVIIECDEKYIREYIKKLNKALNDASVKLPYSLSISAGYSVYDDSIVKTSEELVKLADKKMYKNKKNI